MQQSHAEWGYTASVCMIICRIVQGLSSIGEIVGAEIYITEITNPPIRYFAVAIIETIGLVGATVALIITTVAVSSDFNWRIAFWFGATIAVVGGTARRILIETPEFANAKLQLKRTLEAANINLKKINNPIVNEKINKKNVLAYFALDCFWPLSYYFAYFHCGVILKDTLGFTTEQVIQQNLLLSIIQIVPWLTLSFLSCKIHPLKLLRIKLFIFLPFLLICPFLLNNVTNGLSMLLIQSFIITFSPTTIPAVPILLHSLPLFKRFTCSGLIYACSRAMIFSLCSFGLIYLTAQFNHYAILFIMIPVSIGYIFGLRHFGKLV